MKGKLRIYLGYAAGTGKTYAMLTAAREAQKQGVDVVAGYIEPHDRPETEALTKGLEAIPMRAVTYKGIFLREFDLDAALKRKPRLLLVDELAHTNAAGSRNEKRYQDVRELLQAGIDVYSTMNIQHLESLNDLVGSITGIVVRETVPDFLFDQADQVEVVDIEPVELTERMKAGKIYGRQQAELALTHFFRKEKLAALREIALRRTADRVNRIAEEQRNAMGHPAYHTEEHILVGISAAPSSAKVIRTASRLAYAFRGRFTGLYVETPAMQEADDKTKAALKKNLELAKQLGARIVTVYGADVISQIAEYAVVSNVSKVVMGRTNHRSFGKSAGREALERLTAKAPDLDVYIIPDMRQTGRYHPKYTQDRAQKAKRQAAGRLAALAGVLGFTGALTALVQLAESLVQGRWSVERPGDAVTFLILLPVGLFLGGMTGRLKQQNREIAKNAYRTELLLENSRKLRRCKSREAVWEAVAGQTQKLLNLSLLLYPVSGTGLAEAPLLFPAPGRDAHKLQECLSEQERGVAQWVAANHHRAGACTHTLPEAKALYLPIQDAEEVKGVLGILLEERRPIREFEYGLLIAMLNETGVKLSNG